jgi:hypothetical protein
MMFLPHRKHIDMTLRSVTRLALLLYVDDVPTSQETHQYDSTVCYEDSFTLLYVDDVRTSQEARPVTWIVLLFYM